MFMSSFSLSSLSLTQHLKRRFLRRFALALTLITALTLLAYAPHAEPLPGIDLAP
jgi:hypothetical protein